jgi:hypothetical protein
MRANKVKTKGKVKRRPRPNSRARLKKINHSLYLEPWQSEALAALSAKAGVPQQVILRAGLLLAFEKYDTDTPEAFDMYVAQAKRKGK